MPTVLSEKQVATSGKVGCGADCHALACEGAHIVLESFRHDNLPGGLSILLQRVQSKRNLVLNEFVFEPAHQIYTAYLMPTV